MQPANPEQRNAAPRAAKDLDRMGTLARRAAILGDFLEDEGSALAIAARNLAAELDALAVAERRSRLRRVA